MLDSAKNGWISVLTKRGARQNSTSGSRARRRTNDSHSGFYGVLSSGRPSMSIVVRGSGTPLNSLGVPLVQRRNACRKLAASLNPKENAMSSTVKS